MLVSINVNPAGESTNYKTKFFNFMASLYSVATTAAGGTPTAVNPVKVSDGTKNTGYNCITVLSNTEAGGWSVGTSNNITPSTTYNASGASLVVDLYQPTGKTTYPNYRMTFGNFDYPFSSNNFESYNELQYYQGASQNNPASTAYGSDTAFYNQSSSFKSPNSSMTSYPGYTCIDIVQVSSYIYVAVTASYLIIMTDYCTAYFGIRETSGWEASRIDNPPWTAFGFNGRLSNQVAAQSRMWDYYYGWSAIVGPTGTQVDASKLGKQANGGGGVVSPSGQYNSSVSRNYWGADPYTNYLQPLFALSYPVNAQMANYQWSPDSPTTDPATGLTVPSVTPLIFTYRDGTYAASGKMPGCYKGMSSTKAGLDYVVTASEYTIGSEVYVAVRTGNPLYPDLFLLRKA
jgi:hypothetical protein